MCAVTCDYGTGIDENEPAEDGEEAEEKKKCVLLDTRRDDYCENGRPYVVRLAITSRATHKETTTTVGSIE